MGGRYKAYPEYKDSGVEWLGAVPADWIITACRGIVQNLMDKNEGARDQNYLSLMANIGVIKYEDKGDVGNKKPEDLTKCKIVKKGNLVINSMNYAIGSYGMSDFDGVCSPVYIVLDAFDSVVERRFALRVFENKPFQKYLSIFGNGILEHRAAISWDDIKGAYVAIPSKAEQLSILNFLDHETAKIDTLIEKQQQLIQLLKEKREAVISFAVTKGLNPDAPMKPSGIEWLGDVPEHWEVMKLKRVTLSRCDGPFGSGLKSEHYCDEGIRVIRLQNIRSGQFYDRDSAFISPQYYKELGDHSVVPGDLLIAGLGDENHPVGRACVAPSNIGPAMVKADCFRFRLNSKLASASYLALQLSTTANALAGALSTGTTRGRMNLSSSETREIALPPLAEQVEIIGFLESELAKFDTLTPETQRAIDLLQERRTALISAAVNGKIDVRDWAPPTPDHRNKEAA